MIERWVLERLNPLRNEQILLHDPQRMIHSGAVVVDVQRRSLPLLRNATEGVPYRS